MIMRTFIPVLLCFLLLVAHRGYAHETFAPLLTENTILFVHVDFSKLDVDTVRAEAMTIAENFLTALGFDARSKAATLRDLETELEKLDAMVRPTWEFITKELGIQEIALIGDEGFYKHGNEAGYVLVVSWKGKTDEDLQKLYSFLSSVAHEESLPKDAESLGSHLVSAGGFLFANIDFEEDLFERIITEWVAIAADSNDSPIRRATQSIRQSDEIKAFFMVQKLLNAPAFREAFELDDFFDDSMEEDMPKELRDFILFATTAEWIAVSLPVSEIYAGTVEDARRLVTIKMPSADDAKTFLELMDSAHDAWWSFVAEDMQEDTGYGFVLPPLFFEYAKGSYRTLFPDVEEDALIFRMRHLRQYMRLSFFPFVR